MSAHKVVRFAEVGSVIAGQHIEAAHYNRTNDGVAYLTGPDDFGAIEPIVTKWTNCPKVMAKQTDVLLTVKGAGVGKSNLSTNAAIGRQLMALRPNESRLNQKYLFRLIQSLESEISRLAKGATVPGIPKPAIERLEIPLPPLSEQKRIADILDKADAIRRKRQEAVSMVESELLRSTFRERLGDPITNPWGWQVRQLGDVINFIGGSQPPKTTFVNHPQAGYVRLIQIRDFKTDKYPTYIPKQHAKRPFSKDDVMIARYGPPVFQILRGLEGTYNVALMKAENTEHTTKDFIFYLLQIHEIHDVVVANSQRTAGQSGTNLTLLKGLQVPIPPVEKQNEITSVLKSIEKYVASAREAFAEANLLFNTLTQRAFNGEL